jgi:hypothetical protein
MITSNYSGRWMHVVPHAMPYINVNSGQASAGLVRYNPNSACLEATDGMSWHQLRPGATIDLNADAQRALDWAFQKMQEERRLEQLMEKHPGLRDLKEKFDIMLALTKQENTNGS